TNEPYLVNVSHLGVFVPLEPGLAIGIYVIICKVHFHRMPRSEEVAFFDHGAYEWKAISIKRVTPFALYLSALRESEQLLDASSRDGAVIILERDLEGLVDGPVTKPTFK